MMEKTMGEFRNLLKVGASLTRAYMQSVHRKAAARWPHGLVGTSPAATGDDLATIGSWMKIPWAATGIVVSGDNRLSAGVPLPDQTYREILKDPFGYHRAKGRIDGIQAALKVLGYTDVIYLDFDDLQHCPTWVPPGATGAQLNQNAFGLACTGFPENWNYTMGTPVLGSPLDTLIKAVKDVKRASSRLCEIKISFNVVVTQSSYEAGGPYNIVQTESSTSANPSIVICDG
jgi:hypothetical protein